MKETKVLIEEAKNIIARELLSCRHNINFDNKEGRELRRYFMSACMEDVNIQYSPGVFLLNKAILS